MTVSDEILEQARNKLYTAVISDTLDGMGILSQALPPSDEVHRPSNVAAHKVSSENAKSTA